jgi:hypothetical protein
MFRIAPEHPLADVIGDALGVATAHEQRDGALWLVVDFPDYGTHCDSASVFVEV